VAKKSVPKARRVPPISFPRANRSVGVCFFDPDNLLKKDIYQIQNHLPATTAARSRSLLLAQSQSSALPLLFTVFGVIMGSWAGRIPAMAERVHVSHSALSMVLLCGGLGAVLSYPISSRMMSSLGARKTMLFSGLAPLAGVASMAYSGSLMGPPVIGAVAQGMGMQIAIAYIGALACLIAFVASRSRLLK